MANRLKERWKAGKAAVNGWLSVPSAFSAELVAKAGWDSVTVDLQHGLHDFMTAVDCFRGIQLQGGLPMARVPSSEASLIGKLLDAGAGGIICPLVNTAEDAKRFVDACRYPPVGSRSFGPLRAGLYTPAGTSFVALSNEDIVCMAMIETREGVNNLDAILDVPGLDAVYIGPGDLSLSLGLEPRADREEPEVRAIYDLVLQGTAKRGKVAGIHCMDPDYASRCIKLGFRFATVGSDFRFLLTGAATAVAQTRKGAAEHF